MDYSQDAIREAMRMAQSDAGQQLIRMLQQSGGQELNQAIDRAASGDLNAAKALISNLMKNPQAMELMKQMGGSHGSNGR